MDKIAVKHPLTLLLLLVIWLSCISLSSLDFCSDRHVLNSTWGVISDGPKNYKSHSHCEWLIEVTEPGKVINLVFHSMETECSYDHLFVYDGMSYESKMLGAFSGDTLPEKLFATSGNLLLYFYSDWNYEKKGFEAHFSVTDCPFNCSGNNGHCNTVSHTCVCNAGYTGLACEIETCPGNCNGHGSCNTTSQKCMCQTGYGGYGCTLPISGIHGTTTLSAGGMWHHLAPENQGITPRAAHTGTFIEKENSLFIFGGNTLNGFSDELVKYDFNKNTWVGIVKALPWPSPRHSHAMCEHNGKLYVFGGILEEGTHTNEFWVYNISENLWTDKSSQSSVKPRPVASHTLTLVKNQYIYLFGGRTADGEFISDIYRTDLLKTKLIWEKVIPKGGKKELRRLVGHSAVYHEESQSILIFGGFTPDSARFPQRTNNLHTYHVLHDYWTEIVYDNGIAKDHPVPSIRGFHSAAIMGNYMVVYGGNAHIHTELETCYDGEVYFYHLGCHTWFKRQDLEAAFNATPSNVPHQGRFSSVAVPAFGNALLVFGGYRGEVLGDLIAYKVPVSVARNKNDHRYDSTTHCLIYKSENPCTSDAECVWCKKRKDLFNPGCIARSQEQSCLRAVSSGTCQSICSSLQDCGSCTVLSEGAQPSSGGHNAYSYNHKCEWCVKEARCNTKEIPVAQKHTDTCELANRTVSGIIGWWNGLSESLTSLAQCRLQDYPAGIHVLSYNHPQNMTQPDEVKIIRESSTEFVFGTQFKSRDYDYEGQFYTVKMIGYIHPLGAKPLVIENHISLLMTATLAATELYVSLNESAESKELVAELSHKTHAYKTAARFKGPMFANESRGYKYYAEITADHKINRNAAKSTMTLEWTGAKEAQDKLYRRVIDYEFLEPYSDGNCWQHETCLACMTDTACGWCSLNSKCLLRSDVKATCMSASPPYTTVELVMNPQDCVTCGDKIGCTECLQDALCEWSVTDAKCTRNGRFDDSTKTLAECHPKCEQRKSCSDCIGKKDECAWCESTQKCFPFMEYVVRYAYGGCGDWVDKSGVCHNCSKHRNATLCLDDFRCGWCGNTNNPTIGLCVDGDFSGPSNQVNCTQLIADSYTLAEPSSWHYSAVPDVEECRLELDDCHVNATCINTETSYECKCERGYTGDGKQYCNQTCFYKCIYGTCSKGPSFECLCETGWTGDECNVNCGCNNHSSCSQGIGKCDACQHMTTGSHCQECLNGAYGNATTALGCSKCDCNGHADPSQNYCDKLTGICYCKENTKGDHCEKCINGYYGDPRNERKCYLKCEGRTVIANATEGAIGSREGYGMSKPNKVYCLWIITPYINLNEVNSAVNLSPVPVVSLTIEDDLRVACTQDHVYVYDGIPAVVRGSDSASRDTSVLLGSFCGDGLEKPITVTAQSGVMSVLFQGNTQLEGRTLGFNATFKVNKCPSECSGNRVCDANQKCKCAQGYGGPNCDIKLCPDNCGTGHCDSLVLKQCVCLPNHVGDVCESKIQENKIAIQLLEDPQRTLGLGVYTSDIPRMGHTVITCGTRDIYMFGGYSLNHGPLNDLWTYNVGKQQWKHLSANSSDIPSPRYLHAAVCEPTKRSIYVFGGLVGHLGAQNDLWKFSTKSLKWTKIENITPGSISVPSLAGHSMIYNDNLIYIIGGFSKMNYFSNQTYLFNVITQKWSVLTTAGYSNVGVYGHSTVLYENSYNIKFILLYGGYEFQFDDVKPSSRLYSLNLSSNKWNILPSERDNKPEARFFHSAVSTSEYMILYGGKSRHDKINSGLMIYRFKCNRWLTASQLTVDVANNTNVVKSLIFQMDGNNNTNFTSSVLLGSDMPAVHSGRAVLVDNDVYIIGGFNAQTQGALYKVTLPTDFCAIYTEFMSCLAETGCSACVVPSKNKTYCYSTEGNYPNECITTGAINHTGATCNLQLHLSRDCNEFTTCSECLTQWPVVGYHNNVCKWCAECEPGKCIRTNQSCSTDHPCGANQSELSISDSCYGNLCHVADCSTCLSTGTCVWTNKLKRTGEIGHLVNAVPTYNNYNCIRKLAAVRAEISISPNCPSPCHYHLDCGKCLSSTGSQGGENECIWSSKMQQCMPIHYLELFCSAGQCGHLLQGKDTLCPKTCSHYKKCSECLSHPECGWCSLEGMNGQGLCMEGGLDKPTDGMCNRSSIAPVSKVTPGFQSEIKNSPGVFVWAYMKCPLENECLNNHSYCTIYQDCIDLEDGYRCQCKTGYEEKFYANPKGGITDCEPVCKQGCVKGTCDKPDKCNCQFSYVGTNCSLECLCNGHSQCNGTSLEQRKQCKNCMNNTKGGQCQHCKPLYKGDPRNGSVCHPCKDFCNQHSEVCMTKEDFTTYQNFYGTRHVDKAMISSLLSVGPKTNLDTVCVNCQNHAKGANCSECMDGYFRPSEESTVQPCRACECNGHSNKCDSRTGICENCRNNTKSQASCGTSGTSNKCWEVQCSECTEKYLGTPTSGHQCYLEMNIDSDYCYDSSTQDKCCYDPYTQRECLKQPTVLSKGKAMFYAIQPKYLNVDIRIVLDVTHGALDVFLSPFEDTWIVRNDPDTWEHIVDIDPKYMKHIQTYKDGSTGPVKGPPLQRSKRESFHEPFIYSSSIGGQVSSTNVWALPDPLPFKHQVHKRRRDTASKLTSSNVTTKAAQSSDLYDNRTIKLVDTSAEGMFSFKAIHYNETFLIVRNVQNRLVISLPFTIHQLKINRFYMILQGRGTSKSNDTYGSVFFRQDQPHIDLFVFFAVFFASFFMKLAIIVLIWKIKQSYDAQRSRQQRQEEMRHMASRPFAKSSVMFDPVYNWDNETGEECNNIAASGENMPLLVKENSDISTLSLNCNGAANYINSRENSKHDFFRPKSGASVATNQNEQSHQPTNLQQHNSHHTQNGGIHPLSLPSLRHKHRIGVVSSNNSSRNSSIMGFVGGGNTYDSHYHHSGNNSQRANHIHPMALEPLDDGIAAIGTVLLQLPGGLHAPVGLSFGSALVSSKGFYPSLQRQQSASANARNTTTLPRQGSTSV